MAAVFTRQIPLMLAIGLALISNGTGRSGWAGQEEQFTPEFRELRTSFDPKHTPKITAPESVKRGQWFDVTVDIGAGGEHPSLSEHAIRYIALYINTAEIARVYLHPVYCLPIATDTVVIPLSPTTTCCVTVPKLSCQTCIVYFPRGTFSRLNSPCS